MILIVTRSAFARIGKKGVLVRGTGSVRYHDYDYGYTTVIALKFRELHINLKNKIKGFPMLSLTCQPFPKVHF